MRIVMDSNVLISALIAPQGTSAKLVRLLTAEDQIVFLISSDTMEELRRVLLYPKIKKLLKWSSHETDRFLSSIELLSEYVNENIPVPALECRDPKDIQIMRAAVQGQADYLITGDHDLLDLETVSRIPIVSPAEFLKRF